MVRVALVGCGRVAHRHAGVLASGSVLGASLVAVCDVVPERAAAFGERYGARAFTDMHEMARSVDLDAFSIVTPSGFHAEHVMALAPHGRHLIVEKPMALTLDHADAMIRACEAHQVKLFVVMQSRFDRAVGKLREALGAGRFGTLVLGTARVRRCRPQSYYDEEAWRGTWALDGGVLANQAIHHIDLLQWMMGPVESVFAKTTTALAKIEAEDTAVALLKFRSGALGLIEATTAARPMDLEGSISILGEGGSVEIGGSSGNLMKTWRFAVPAEEDEEALRLSSAPLEPAHASGHQAYYEHVVDSLAGKVPPLVDGLEGRKSLELVTAIYGSAESGREVALRATPALGRLGGEARRVGRRTGI